MPFDFEDYEKECRAMSTEQLQLEWENYTRQIAGASTSTAASVLLSGVTLGISLVGVAASAPRIHNARKKREIIEARLAARGATYDTRIRDVAIPMVVNGTVSAMTLGFFNPGGSAAAAIVVGRKHSKPTVEPTSTTHALNEPPRPGPLHHAATWPTHEEKFKHGIDLPIQVTQSNHTVSFHDPSSVPQQDPKDQIHGQIIYSQPTTQSSIPQAYSIQAQVHAQTEPTNFESRELNFTPIYGAMPTVPVPLSAAEEENRYLRARINQLEHEKRNWGFLASPPAVQVSSHFSVELHDDPTPSYLGQQNYDTHQHEPPLSDGAHKGSIHQQSNLQVQDQEDYPPPPLPERTQSVPEISIHETHIRRYSHQPQSQATTLQRKRVGSATRPPRPHSVMHQSNQQLHSHSETPLHLQHHDPKSYSQITKLEQQQQQNQSHNSGQQQVHSHAQTLQQLQGSQNQIQQQPQENHNQYDHTHTQHVQYSVTQHSSDYNLQQQPYIQPPQPQYFHQTQTQTQTQTQIPQQAYIQQPSYTLYTQPQAPIPQQQQQKQQQQRQDSGYYSTTSTPSISSPSPPPITTSTTGIFSQSMPHPPPYIKPGCSGSGSGSGSAQDYFDQSANSTAAAAASKLGKRKSRLDMGIKGWDWSKEKLQGLASK